MWWSSKSKHLFSYSPKSLFGSIKIKSTFVNIESLISIKTSLFLSLGFFFYTKEMHVGKTDIVQTMYTKSTFIRAKRGEKTIATFCSFIIAGNWKQRDFPEPVGIHTNTSCFPRIVNVLWIGFYEIVCSWIKKEKRNTARKRKVLKLL